MSIIIDYWVVYVVLLSVNISQLFWGLSLQKIFKKNSFLNLVWVFPMFLMTCFGLVMAIGRIATDSNPKEMITVFVLYICWIILTGIISITMICSHFTKKNRA